MNNEVLFQTLQSFVAGADVDMLAKCKNAEEASRISRDAKIQFERLEHSKKPVCIFNNKINK